jgi:single-stranded DNA-binding protein
MNYQRLVLVGNATADAERKKSRKGDVKFTTFRLGVGDAKDRTTFFPVTAFGELGKKMAKYITKGKQLLVEGRIAVDEEGRFNVLADRIQLGARGSETAK